MALKESRRPALTRKEGLIARLDKVAGVESLADSMKNATAVVLTKYRGLNVKQMRELRLTLGGETRYAVAKSKLSKLTLKEARVEGLGEHLVSPTAIVFVGHDGDPVATTKVVSKFAKEDLALVVKGGLADGNVTDAEDIKKLASLKPRKVLLVKSTGVLKTLMYRAAAAMVAPVSKTIRIIDASCEK